MEQEIDIRKYALAILRRWRSIVTLGVLTALIALGISLMLPKSYTATAGVLIFVRQTGSQLGVNDPIMSVETIDVVARRQGLLALAGSDAIESALPEAVIRSVGGADYKPGLFVQKNQVTVLQRGDLLEIAADGATPEQARDLANAWATTLIDQITTLYTDQHSSAQLASQALLPIAPSSPAVMQNTAAGAAGGLLLGVLAALISAVTGVSLARPHRVSVERERATTQPSPTR